MTSTHLTACTALNSVMRDAGGSASRGDDRQPDPLAACPPSPPLRGRCPRRGQRGVSASRQTIPLRVRRTASPPSVSKADISPSRGEKGVRRAAKLPFDTGSGRRCPGPNPGPLQRALEARPRCKAEAAEHMQGAGGSASSGDDRQPDPLAARAFSPPLRGRCPQRGQRGGSASRQTQPFRMRRTASPPSVSRADISPSRGERGVRRASKLPFDTGSDRRRPGLDPGPLQPTPKARPRLKAGAAWHMRGAGRSASSGDDRQPNPLAARAFSPPLRGRCPRRGQRGVSACRHTQPFRMRRDASPPSVSRADISPSRGESGVRRAARKIKPGGERLPFGTASRPMRRDGGRR